MKISLVLSSQPNLGGGFQYSQSILNALISNDARKTGLNLSVVTLNDSWENKLEEIKDTQVTKIKVPTYVRKLRGFCIRAGTMGIWDRLRVTVNPLTRHLSQSNPQLVITPCEPVLCVDSPKPIVAPIHDLMYCYETQFPEVQGSFARRRRAVDKLVTSRCKTVLVDSQVGARHVLEQFKCPPSRVKVLPFCGGRSLKERESSGQKPKCSLPNRFIFYPAQFWTHKNHIGLVRAIALLRDQGIDVPCVLCGSEKNSYSTVKAEVQRLNLEGHIYFVGFVTNDELNWLYQNADAMVMPSFFGPTNIPPLEAMTFGCPVLAADVYGTREQLGKAAKYFNPQSPKDIAALIQKIWANHEVRREMKELGIALIKEKTNNSFTSTLIKILLD